jgi:hypothetical protein
MGKKRTLKTRKKKINRRKKTLKVKKGGLSKKKTFKLKGGVENNVALSRTLIAINKLYDTYIKAQNGTEKNQCKSSINLEIDRNIGKIITKFKITLPDNKSNIEYYVKLGERIANYVFIPKGKAVLARRDLALKRITQYQSEKLYLFDEKTNEGQTTYTGFIPLKSIPIEYENQILDILYEIYDNKLLYINTEKKTIKYKVHIGTYTINGNTFGFEPTESSSSNEPSGFEFINSNQTTSHPSTNSSTRGYGFDQ